MTCKDCVHQEACFDWCRGFVETTELCEHFKDKSKFIELPCKVGDKVWFIKFMWNYAKQPIPAMVCGIKTFSSSGTFTFTALTDENNVARSFINQDIGKTVFLTYEAAEAALKEREQNEKAREYEKRGINELQEKLKKEAEARKKQADIITEERSQKYEQIRIIDSLKEELEQVKKERDVAVKCIEDIEVAFNFQRVSAIGLRISEWRGLEE